ncbi:AraC family transcriptional regulator [Spirochaeta cellobiosiphila]|uniref:AraC family transcriptional regulator n=1 Tax=Spirochaeta cellobiosiphila TaxID=504483 RepID=UPI000400D17B|nr:AraC family transcriptional regulator [Spirochaeta cellobiosiphila]
MAIDTQKLYQLRINKAIDYINTHLDSKLSIEQISNEVCFSSYHFHRIFTAFVGESLYAYINRLRVEKAAALLLTSTNNVTDIAYIVGFSDSSVFARAFKKRFGCSASSWIQKKNSKNHQVNKTTIPYNKIRAEEVKVSRISERRLVYIRNIGPFSGSPKVFMDLHLKLLAELNNNSIDWEEDKGFFALYHDSYGITEDNKQRISYGVISQDKITDDASLGALKIWENDYLIARYTLSNEEYGKAWISLFRETLPSMGMEPVDGLCFENYYKDCYDKDLIKSIVRIAVPVKKMK